MGRLLEKKCEIRLVFGLFVIDAEVQGKFGGIRRRFGFISLASWRRGVRILLQSPVLGPAVIMLINEFDRVNVWEFSIERTGFI